MKHTLLLPSPETVGEIFQNTGQGTCIENQLSKYWDFGELCFFPLRVWKFETGVSFSSIFHSEDNLHLHKIMASAHLLNDYVRSNTHQKVMDMDLREHKNLSAWDSRFSKIIPSSTQLPQPVVSNVFLETSQLTSISGQLNHWEREGGGFKFSIAPPEFLLQLSRTVLPVVGGVWDRRTVVWLFIPDGFITKDDLQQRNSWNSNMVLINVCM